MSGYMMPVESNFPAPAPGGFPRMSRMAADIPPLCPVPLRLDARFGICRGCGGRRTAPSPEVRIGEMSPRKPIVGAMSAPPENDRP